MSNIKKKESELPEATIYAKIENGEKISIGDLFRQREEIIRIDSIEKNGKYTNYKYHYLISVDPLKWGENKHEISADSLSSYYSRIDKAFFSEGHDLYKKYIESNYDLSAFKPDESIDNSTAIVAIGSKEYLELMQNEAVAQAKRVESIKMFVTAQMEIARRQAEALRTQLEATLAVFKKQIKKIYKVLQTIELYLGISEELVQIQEGMPASSDTPISFRQAILFMDEEVAVWEHGGLDYSNIPEFENWLLTDKNYEKVAPEEKCLVVFKPRRLKKKHHSDDIIQAQMDTWDKQTYFLIRNGENIYRISSANIAISKRLFPQREELVSMLNSVDEEKWERDKERAKEKFEDTFDQYRCMAFLMQGLMDRTEIFNPMPFKINIFNLEEAGNAVQFIYDDELALPTGRKPFWDWHTDINKGINAGSRVLLTGQYSSNANEWFNSDEFSDRFAISKRRVPEPPTKNIYEVFVRYETTTDNLPHYEVDRLQKLGLVLEVDAKLYEGLCKGYETSSYNIQPEEGVVVEYFSGSSRGRTDEYVKAYKCKYKKEVLYIKYNPKDKVYHGWDDYSGRERTNNLSFTIYRDDHFVLNYDHISIEDIDFYIHSRSDRKSYYNLMPLLKSIKEKLLQEMQNENNFVKLMVGTVISAQISNISDEKAEAFVRELIVWWKFRTNQKRPISKDDTLAMRMIERRLKAAVNRKKLVNVEA